MGLYSPMIKKKKSVKIQSGKAGGLKNPGRIKARGLKQVVVLMGLGFLDMIRGIPEKVLCQSKWDLAYCLLRRLLKWEFIMIRLFFLVLLLVIRFLVPIMLL